MSSREIVVKRPAEQLEGDSIVQLIRTACEFKSAVTIRTELYQVNAKSMMGVLALGLEPGMKFRLEAEGGRLCRAVIEYILTCFRSHDPTVSLEPVIAGLMAATEDAAREGVQDAVELVAERFQRDPTDDE